MPRHKYEEREVKAWVIPVRHEKGQAVVCYERCIFDLDDYQKAIDRSRCKLHHPQAPIIRPLYSQFITRQEWKGIFFECCMDCTFCTDSTGGNSELSGRQEESIISEQTV